MINGINILSLRLFTCVVLDIAWREAPCMIIGMDSGSSADADLSWVDAEKLG